MKKATSSKRSGFSGDMPYQALILASMAAITARLDSSNVGLRCTGAGLTFKLRRRVAALERTLCFRVVNPSAMTNVNLGMQS
jgi:hypothetical protein